MVPDAPEPYNIGRGTSANYTVPKEPGTKTRACLEYVADRGRVNKKVVEQSKQLVLGLTGNIACGKSTVLRMLAELGADTVDADHLVHRALAPGGGAYPDVAARWGADVMTEQGEIDRSKLGRLVFADPDQLRELEGMVHPHVHAEILQRIQSATRPLVVDALKLVENGLFRHCDEVWVVTCTPEQQLERLMRRNNLSKEDALLRVRAQPPLNEKLRVADVIIPNDGTEERTQQHVRSAWNNALLRISDGHTAES